MAGRFLHKGDVLQTLAGDAPPVRHPSQGLGVIPPAFSIPNRSAKANDKTLWVRVRRAGEYDLFPPKDMHETFWSAEWKITTHSDRGSYRLAGPA